MLFRTLVSPEELATATLKDRLLEGSVNALPADEYCRAVSFIDHWKGDLFIPKWPGSQPWAGGRTLASGRIEGETHDFTLAACHSALITYTHNKFTSYAKKVDVVLPFLYSWTDFNAGGELEPKEWLNEGCPALSSKRINTKESPIPFKVFVDFYNWYLDAKVNPVLANAQSFIDNVEVYRVGETPVGVKFTFNNMVQMKKLGALLNLSRFLYDSFYTTNTIKRRKNITNYLDQGLTMQAAVILSELNDHDGDQCGHALCLVHSKLALFNWLANTPVESTAWTNFWERPHQYPLQVIATAKLTLHDTLKDWIKKGLIPDVYVRQDTKVPEGVRSGEPRVSLGSNNVRARRVPTANVAPYR